MKTRGSRPPQQGPDSHWLTDAQVRTFRRGESIIQAGSPLAEWIAISEGAACLAARVAPDTRVAVAALWLGDVIGADSPLGKLAASYDVTALVDVTTLHIPLTRVRDRQPGHGHGDEADELYAATASRLQEQITMRLAGNGLQRLVSMLATLATALGGGPQHHSASNRLALPVSQATIGQLAGLSRRQTWIYLGQLAERGWSRTARTRVVLEGQNAWLALMAEVEQRGLACIATLDDCDATLSRLALQRPG